MAGGAGGGHAGAMTLRTVGVEEELLLVEPGTGRPRAVAGTVLRAAQQVVTGPGDGADAGPVASEALEFELQLQSTLGASVNERGEEVEKFYLKFN